jgi:hypothetical protein
VPAQVLLLLLLQQQLLGGGLLVGIPPQRAVKVGMRVVFCPRH